MSGSPQWVLQQAVYTRLTADADLNALVGSGIYDHVPAKSAFPYITIGDVTEVPNDTMQTSGRDVTLTLHYWSQAKGMKETHQIHDAVTASLDRWQGSIAGWGVTQMLLEFYDTFRDPDGVTRHGVARFRVHAHQDS